MRELRIAVIDDDFWKREHMAQELDSSPHIAVVHALDQDTAVKWSLAQWDAIDIAIVDVVDEMAPGEVGTDMFSGIQALEKLKSIDVKTLAITPHRHHPVVELRIYQADVNWVYRRFEVNDLDRLVNVLLAPSLDHRPVRPSDEDLVRFGAQLALPNNSVRVFEQSEFHGILAEDSGRKELGTTYRKLERFRIAIARTGFKGTEYRTSNGGPRWPDVRAYLLRALGRKDQ
jgi:hypothetical protein